jgi:hypothetical protein
MTIFVKCYGELKLFNSVEDAKGFYMEGLLSTEGSEQQRYTQIYTQLCNGLSYCSDETDNYRVLKNMERMLQGT